MSRQYECHQIDKTFLICLLHSTHCRPQTLSVLPSPRGRENRGNCNALSLSQFNSLTLILSHIFSPFLSLPSSLLLSLFLSLGTADVAPAAPVSFNRDRRWGGVLSCGAATLRLHHYKRYPSVITLLWNPPPPPFLPFVSLPILVPVTFIWTVSIST